MRGSIPRSLIVGAAGVALPALHVGSFFPSLLGAASVG